MKTTITMCTMVVLLASCASVPRSSEPDDITRYADLLRALREPVDIRAEIASEYDCYTRLLYLPSFSAPVCITVRGGVTVLPGQALVRTQVIQTGRGQSMSTSWEPGYTRVLSSTDSMISLDSHMELLSRMSDLRLAPTNAVPIELAGLDGETCVLEHAEGTNQYMFVSVWSPDALRLDENMAKGYEALYPGRSIDVAGINEFLQRTINVLAWFAEQTHIEQLDHFKFKEESFQQDGSTVPDGARERTPSVP